MSASFLCALALTVASGSCAPTPGKAPAAQGDGIPKRIVSMNPCVDAVLMEVADPRNIAAISHYSHDPRATSIPIDLAHRFPAVADEAEDILAMAPDLVIAGTHVSASTLAAIRRLGIPLMQVEVPTSVAQDEAQITAIARRIGRAAQGQQLNRRINFALRAAAPQRGRPVPALIWQSSGLVPGKDTLANELLTRTGFRNLSVDMGLAQWDIMPLEDLLVRPPHVLLAGLANMGAGDADANRMLSHPALQSARSEIRIADFPSGMLHCGGPVIMRAAARLAAIRRGLNEDPRL